MWKKITALVFRYRAPIIAVFATVTLFFGYWITKVQINSDATSYLTADDPAVALFNRLDDRFGGNDLVMIALKAPDIFTAQALRDIDVLTDAYGGIAGVSSVTSLTNVMDIRKGVDGSIEIGKLIDPDDLPATESGLQALRNNVMSRERYRGSLVSTDAASTLIVCQLARGTDKNAIVRAMQAAARATGVREELYFGGVPVLAAELGTIILHDLTLLIPIVLLLIVLTLFVSFGTVRGVLVPLISVIISTVWVMGLMGLLHVPLTLVSDIIPALLLAIGTAPCIHILSKYDEDVTRYGSSGEKSQAAFREVGVRVVLAAVTIVLGFSSFIIGSYLTAIRDFGIFSSIGVCFSLIVSVVFVPALLAMVAVRSKPVSPVRVGPRGNPPIARAMRLWGDMVVRHRKAILIAGAIVLVAGAAGMPLIQRKADFALFFPPTNTVRLTEGLLENDFGGSRPLQIRFSGDVQNPFVLKEMLRLERFIEGQGLARNPISVADLIAEMNDIMENRRTVPDSQEKVANLMFLLEGQAFVTRLLSDDKGEAQVQAMTGLLGAAELQRTVDLLDGYIRNLDTNLVEVSVDELPPRDRSIVADYRVQRARDSLGWLAGKRQPSFVFEESGLPEELASLSSGAGRTADREQALARVMSFFPARLQASQPFRDDVMRELDELCQNRTAVPDRVYKGLTVSAGAAPPAIQFKVGWTGMPLISWHLDQSIIKSQAESLVIALVFIFLLLAVRLRSWLGGLIGLIPILLAIVLMFGVMGFAGIPINVATVLVGAIALGIGIDYVIHFSIRFTTYYHGPATAAFAVRQTMQTTGRAIIINVMAVTMGFITLIFAHLLPLQQFGILTAIAMIGSGLGALTLLPALILLAPSAFIGRGMRKGPEGTGVEPGKESAT